MTDTSKAELNGLEGLATSYSSETMRYSVLLNNGRTVALKPANLIQIGDAEVPSGGGGFPGMPAGMLDIRQYLHLLPAWLREKIMRGQAPDLNDLKRLLPPGVTPMHVGFVFVMFLLMMFKFGLIKTLLLFSILGYVLYAGFAAFSRCGMGVAGLKAAGDAIGNDISNRIRVVTQQNIPPFLSLGALGVVLVAVLYFMLVAGRTVPYSSPIGAADSYQYASTGGGLSYADAYDKGFDDAIAGRPHSWSTHSDSFPRSFTPAPEYYTTTPARSSGGLFGGVGIGKMISLGILGKQIHSLGAVPGGGWDHNYAIANFMNMGAMQKVFFGFMFLRLFGMSPI